MKTVQDEASARAATRRLQHASGTKSKQKSGVVTEQDDRPPSSDVVGGNTKAEDTYLGNILAIFDDRGGEEEKASLLVDA